MLMAFQLFTISAGCGTLFVQSGLKNLKLVPFGVLLSSGFMMLGINFKVKLFWQLRKQMPTV